MSVGKLQQSILQIMFIGFLFFAAHAGFCQSSIVGDVNRDNAVNINDALLVAQYGAGLNVSISLLPADVNANGMVDIIDAMLIAQYAAGLIKNFPGQTATSTPTPSPANGSYSFTGTLPNGLVNNAPVMYTTTAGFDGTNVNVTFDGGSGFEWVWIYTPGYHAMINTNGNIWSVSLSGYTRGSTLDYYFTVRKNSQEANNTSAHHIWVVGSSGTPQPTATSTRTPSTTPRVSPTPTPTTSGTYSLVWSDEFTSSIGPDWVFETGNGSGGWGNNELEYYRRENAALENGVLVITARQESYGGFNYTSTRMKTEGKKSWQYGRIEARIKMSLGQGIWPAFWMLGDNISSVSWPACGEIDIMEHINNEATVYGTIHWDSNGHAYYTGSLGVNPADWHVYAIEWNEKAIKWYVDNTLYHEANIENNINSTEEFHKKFFILLNLAVGGNWPGNPNAGTIFPATMYVDYVRVYQ